MRRWLEVRGPCGSAFPDLATTRHPTSSPGAAAGGCLGARDAEGLRDGCHGGGGARGRGRRQQSRETRRWARPPVRLSVSGVPGGDLVELAPVLPQEGTRLSVPSLDISPALENCPHRTPSGLRGGVVVPVAF